MREKNEAGTACDANFVRPDSVAGKVTLGVATTTAGGSDTRFASGEHDPYGLLEFRLAAGIFILIACCCCLTLCCVFYLRRNGAALAQRSGKVNIFILFKKKSILFLESNVLPFFLIFQNFSFTSF